LPNLPWDERFNTIAYFFFFISYFLVYIEWFWTLDGHLLILSLMQQTEVAEKELDQDLCAALAANIVVSKVTLPQFTQLWLV
jgi:hypothetical protein